MEHRAEAESLAAGHRPPYRSHSAWQWSGPASHNASQATKWAEPPPLGHAQSLTRPPKQFSLGPYREPQALHSKRPVSFPETPHAASSAPAGTERGQPHRQPSSSFSAPGSGASAYTRYKPSPERYVATQRAVLPAEQRYSPEVTSSGESSSGGLTSQESTMERHKPEPLWHMPVQSRLPAGPGSSVSKRPSRQELAGKDSPNRHSRGEAQYSSHSSSNTLSSNASSSPSEERWFDTPEPAEVEPDPASKGGSSDSGIDTALYASSPTGGSSAKSSHLFQQRDPGPKAHSAGSKRREPSPTISTGGQSRGYRPKAYAAGASMSGPATAPDHGAELYKQPSNFSLRQGRPAQGYRTPVAENSRSSHMSQSSSFQLSASVPKSFFSKQSSRAKHVSGWKRPEEIPMRPTAFADPKKQIDTTTKNVFGQPRLRASLRDLRSPRKNYKSTIEDDLKKLIIMDSLGPEQERAMSPQKPLQRTLSDESLCSGRRDASYANTACVDQSLASDVLFTSTYPSSTLPSRRQPPQLGRGSLTEKKAVISSSELSLSDGRDKPTRRLDPGLMPLPDTAAGLEWSSLVSAAKAYEVQRAVSLFSLNDSALSPGAAPAHGPGPTCPSLERQLTPRTTPTMSEELPLDLPGKVSQLEAMLKQLHSDLQKEKQDKVVLQAEVASLRQNNQRLQEESQTANEQLRKFAEIFSSTVEKEL